MNTIKSILKDEILDKEKIRQNVLSRSMDDKKKYRSSSFAYIYRPILAMYIIAIIVFIPVYYINTTPKRSNIEEDSVKANGTKWVLDSLSNQAALDIVRSDEKKAIYDSTSMASDMMLYPLEKLMYDGKIYTSLSESDAKLPYEKTLNIRGEELGRTTEKIGLYEFNNTVYNYFSTFNRDTKIYSIQGYDKNFRIMAISNNKVYILDSINEVDIEKGSDLINLLKLDNNTEEVKVLINTYDMYQSIIERKVELQNEFILFITMFRNASKVNMNSEIFDSGKINARDVKTLIVKSKEGITSRIVIYSTGFTYCNDILFKINDDQFEKLYNEL